MKSDFCKSMLRDLRGIHMSERVRVQAEAGVRHSAALVELLMSMAVRRSESPKQHS